MKYDEWCKENCPYYPDCYGAGVCNYVVAILKEHESVKPVRRTEEIEWTVCGFCEKHLISKWAFCPYCGRAVKWDG